MILHQIHALGSKLSLSLCRCGVLACHGRVRCRSGKSPKSVTPHMYTSVCIDMANEMMTPFVHCPVVYNSSQTIAKGNSFVWKIFSLKKSRLSDKITLQNKNKSLELLSSAALARGGGTDQGSKWPARPPPAPWQSGFHFRFSFYPVPRLRLLLMLLTVRSLYMVIRGNVIKYFTWYSTTYIIDIPCSLLHVLPPSTLTRSAFEQLGSK